MSFFGKTGVRGGEDTIGQGRVGSHPNGKFPYKENTKTGSLRFERRKEASQATTDHKYVGAELFHSREKSIVQG